MVNIQAMEYDLPMKVLDAIAELYNEKIMYCIDVNYNICVYVPNINKIYKLRYLKNLEGRGISYHDACLDYLKNANDNKFKLRYKKLYATSKIRKIIRHSGIENYLLAKEIIYDKNKHGFI